MCLYMVHMYLTQYISTHAGSTQTTYIIMKYAFVMSLAAKYVLMLKTF